jgi:hypothetical protein
MLIKAELSTRYGSSGQGNNSCWIFTNGHQDFMMYFTQLQYYPTSDKLDGQCHVNYVCTINYQQLQARHQISFYFKTYLENMTCY